VLHVKHFALHADYVLMAKKSSLKTVFGLNASLSTKIIGLFFDSVYAIEVGIAQPMR